jgi:hypothetical protein
LPPSKMKANIRSPRPRGIPKTVAMFIGYYLGRKYSRH